MDSIHPECKGKEQVADAKEPTKKQERVALYTSAPEVERLGSLSNGHSNKELSWYSLVPSRTRAYARMVVCFYWCAEKFRRILLALRSFSWCTSKCRKLRHLAVPQQTPTIVKNITEGCHKTQKKMWPFSRLLACLVNVFYFLRYYIQKTTFLGNIVLCGVKLLFNSSNFLFSLLYKAITAYMDIAQIEKKFLDSDNSALSDSNAQPSSNTGATD